MTFRFLTACSVLGLFWCPRELYLQGDRIWFRWMLNQLERKYGGSMFLRNVGTEYNTLFKSPKTTATWKTTKVWDLASECNAFDMATDVSFILLARARMRILAKHADLTPKLGTRIKCLVTYIWPRGRQNKIRICDAERICDCFHGRGKIRHYKISVRWRLHVKLQCRSFRTGKQAVVSE